MIALACADAFKPYEPTREYTNVGGFLLLGIGWLAQWKEIWRLVPRRPGLAWAAAAVFCVTMMLAGQLFFVWWPRNWAAWWVIIPTVIATGFVMTSYDPAELEGKPKVGAGTKPPPGVAPAGGEPPPLAPAGRAEPPTLPAAPRRPRRLRPVLLVGTLLGVLVFSGMAIYLFGGPGGARMREEARAYFGSAEAQLALGWRYREGEGKSQDFGEAAKWFERAARKGSARAEYDLGVLYYYGLGRPADLDQARGYLERAAKQDYSAANTFLGLIARDADQDQERAMILWKTAAGAGDPWAEYLLGSAYLARRSENEGNIIMALYWLELARRDGVEPIQGLLQHVWATVPDEDQDHVADEVFSRLDGPPAEAAAPESVATTTP